MARNNAHVGDVTLPVDCRLQHNNALDASRPSFRWINRFHLIDEVRLRDFSTDYLWALHSRLSVEAVEVAAVVLVRRQHLPRFSAAWN